MALVASSGGGDTIGVNKPVDLPEPETQSVDIEIVPNVGTSDEAESAIHRNDQTSEVVTSGVAGENSGENAGANNDDVAMQSEYSDENAGANDDDVAMRSEHVAKPAPAVAKAPTNEMPIRYLDGKRISEYEWIRSKDIKANRKLLQALELKNAGERIFGEQDGKKGKENKENRGEPSAKHKKIPLANVGTRTLHSKGKAVTNRCVYTVVDRCFIADSSVVLQR